jgi:glycosyltransferase involved in cell wall biosynthesis
VFGALLVRDAADLLAVNVRHHLALGLERILVVDNGSTDGTWELLQDLARRLPLELERDDGPYLQAEIVDRMIRRAAAAGADWVLPIDVDEFFVCERGLHAVLAETDAAALRCEVISFVQRREQLVLDPRALLTMDTRVEHPLDPREAEPHLRAGRLALVEKGWQPSVILRPSEDVRVVKGNHDVTGATGPVRRTDAIVCLHAAVRARAALAERVEHGRRTDAAGEPPELGWHNRVLPDDPEALDALWRANSNRGGYLDVAGVRKPLVPDTRLRDAVAPHLGSPLRRALYRPTRRVRELAARRAADDGGLAELRARLDEQAAEIARLRSQVEGTWEMADLHARVRATTEWIRLADVSDDLLISVITPTRNRAGMLGRAIGSVRRQSYPNWEQIVVDDGSSDNTADAVTEHDDARIRLLRTEGIGAARARNLAIEAARGDYVVYLDDDNAFHEDWLRSVAWAAAQHGADVMYGAILGEFAGPNDASEEQRARGPVIAQSRFDRARLLRENIVDGGQLAHRRDLPEARWDGSIDSAQDWDLLIRLTRDSDPLALPVISLAYARGRAPNRLSNQREAGAAAATIRARYVERG